MKTSPQAYQKCHLNNFVASKFAKKEKIISVKHRITSAKIDLIMFDIINLENFANFSARHENCVEAY